MEEYENDLKARKDHEKYLSNCAWYGGEEGFPPEPKPPKPARSRAFTYSHDDGFLASGISRAPIEELRLLFSKNASQARQAAATKPWLTAQLRLYGITFDKSADIDQLWYTLEAAVKGRKCVEGGPPSVAAIEEKLAAKYAQSLVQYPLDVKKHKIALNEWHMRSFNSLNDPSAEVRHDSDAFFSKYFLDDNGLPAPEKTPEPIILWDLVGYTANIRSGVDAIPGLHAQITYHLTVIAWAAKLTEGIDTAFAMIDRPDAKYHTATLEAFFDPDRFVAKYFLDGLRGEPAPWKQETPLVLKHWVTDHHSLEQLSMVAKHVPDLLFQKAKTPTPNNSWTCSVSCVVVGWAKQVILLVESLESEVAQLEALQIKQEERRKEKAILAKLKPHIDYVRAHRPLPSGPFPLGHLVGSYMIHCRELQDSYGCEMGGMGDMPLPGSRGLAMDRTRMMTLDIHAPTSTYGAIAAFNFGLVEGTMLISTSEDSLEHLRQEQAVRESSDEEDPVQTEYCSESRKRKAVSSRTSNLNFKRRLGADDPQKPGRFYLQWAGCETVEADLVLTEDHERTGYFDIDKSGMTARGEFRDTHLFDKPLVFTLLKVADKPKVTPDDWSSYCEEERWRRW